MDAVAAGKVTLVPDTSALKVCKYSITLMFLTQMSSAENAHRLKSDGVGVILLSYLKDIQRKAATSGLFVFTELTKLTEILTFGIKRIERVILTIMARFRS